MGRPSLAQQRTDEILDAFGRCVSRFGLEGSSLERVAEEAGVQRSILRHYVGNREELIRALTVRVIEKYEDSFAAHLEATGELSPVDQLMSYLFPKQSHVPSESILVIESLIAAGDSVPTVSELIRGYIDRLVGRAAKLLRKEYPNVTRKDCWAIAYGVVSLCFNQESLTPLDLPPKYMAAARSSASVLIRSLESRSKSG